MALVNANYLKLVSSYLFPEISKRVAAFQQANPTRDLIRLGIGDVTQPLPPACIEAFQRGVAEMADAATFKSYGPEQGYEFLRQKIAQFDYQARGVDVGADEIFVSDGSKCDTGNIQELFSNECVVALPDPVYPVYVDTNVMAGRSGANVAGRYSGLVYLEGSEANGFLPMPPSQKVDLIYLCSPNNPTGATFNKTQLAQWVDYARANQAIIFFDAAYEAYIRDESLPHSIYEIPGAREVAIEFRSFSKSAGFTGTRCAFTVIPKSLYGQTVAGDKVAIHPLWNRRHTTKFNGVSYPVQRAAEAVYSEAGQVQVRGLIDFYLENARLILARLSDLGYQVTGGKNSPYIWVKIGQDAWSFFDALLNNSGVVCTPGDGFGRGGQGYIRLTAYNSRDNVIRALERFPRFLRGTA